MCVASRASASPKMRRRCWVLRLLGRKTRWRIMRSSCPTRKLVSQPCIVRFLCLVTWELLKLAVNWLYNSYAPTLRCLKAGLCAEGRTYVNVSGEFTSVASTGIAGTHVARVQLLLGVHVAEPFTSKLVAGKEGRARNASGKCAH